MDDVSIDRESDIEAASPDRPSAASSGRNCRLSAVVVALQVLKWTRVVALPFVVVLFWIGLWNLLDKFLLPDYSYYHGVLWRDFTMMVVGLAGLVLVRELWKKPRFQEVKELPSVSSDTHVEVRSINEISALSKDVDAAAAAPAVRTVRSFQLKKKLHLFARLIVNMTFGIVFWTGAWNFLDGSFESTIPRELTYVVLATVLLFVLEVVMRSDSLNYFFTMRAGQGKKLVHYEEEFDEYEQVF